MASLSTDGTDAATLPNDLATQSQSAKPADKIGNAPDAKASGH